MSNETRTIEFGTVVNGEEVTAVGEIISRRANSHVVFALVSKAPYEGARVRHTIYMCREYTKTLGRKREQRLEWLGEIGGSARDFETREAAVAYANKVA